MANTADVSVFAASMLQLIQRFTGNQPDALEQMRQQVEAELHAGKSMVERAETQLAAIKQLQDMINSAPAPDEVQSSVTLGRPSLKTGVVRILDEQPERVWERRDLYAELVRRGWGPGGANPRNTFTARLRDLEQQKRVRRLDRDAFTSTKNKGARAM